MYFEITTIFKSYTERENRSDAITVEVGKKESLTEQYGIKSILFMLQVVISKFGLKVIDPLNLVFKLLVYDWS